MRAGRPQVRELVEPAMSISAVLDDLYASWWICADVASAVDQPSFPSDRNFDHEAWRILDEDSRGSLTVTRNSEIAVISAGEWLVRDSDSVTVQRRQTWSTEHFVWRSSRRAMPLMARRWRARIYVPASRDPAMTFASIADALDDDGLWFQAKTNVAGVRRADQAVFWVDASDALAASKVASETVAAEAFLLRPPPLCLPLGCIGLSHDPGRGESFGQRVCGAVVSARDACHSWQDVVWARACERFDLVPHAPWRHPRGDPYGIWTAAEGLAEI